MLTARHIALFVASVGLGWGFVWLAYHRPDTIPYACGLIAVALAGRLIIDIREERREAADNRHYDALPQVKWSGKVTQGGSAGGGYGAASRHLVDRFVD